MAGIAQIASLAFVLFLLALNGCGGPKIVPIEGKVLHNGEPLKFGSVMFQPPSGQPARGRIQPDGTFSLSALHAGDGATVGVNQVRVTCYEGQSAATAAGEETGERPLGKSLIDKRYANSKTSGLTVTVKPHDNEVVVLELTGE